MSASLFIILLEIFIFQSLANLDCKTVGSDWSASNDDATVSVGCPSSHPTLTDCGYVVKSYLTYSSTARDGSYIQSNRCYARNGYGGPGIRAVARCCKIEGHHLCYDKKGTVSKDDARVEIKCNSYSNIDFVFGCTATNPWSDFDGTFFGTLRPDEAQYNKDYDLVPTCSVQGSGSTTTGYARCCTAFQYQPTCKIKYGSPAKTSIVECSTGYTMVGCSVFTFWDNTAYAEMITDTCYAGSGNNNNVWASAVCCRYNPPTPAQETQPIPTESVYMIYIYILSAILVCSLIYASITWYKVSKNKKRKYSKVYDFDSQDMESESVKN